MKQAYVASQLVVEDPLGISTKYVVDSGTPPKVSGIKANPIMEIARMEISKNLNNYS